MAHHAPAFGALEEGEIALLSVEAIHALDERLSLSRVVSALARREVAALAVVGAVTREALEIADLHRLCVFGLPDGADLRDVEKDVVRLIVEWEAQLDRRGRQVYRQLAQLSIENRGLPAIAKALVQIVGRPVVIQDEQMAVRALMLPPEQKPAPSAAEESLSTAEIEAELADRAPVSRWLLDRPLDGKAPPCTELPLDRQGWARCVAAVVIDGRLGGYLSILGEASELDDLDRLAAERGALVCAVELAKQRAVEAAEERGRGDLLDLLLTAGAAEERALARRAAEMGYELERYHAVLLFGLGAGISPSSRENLAREHVAREFRARLLHTGIQVFLCPHGEDLAALCSAGDATLLDGIEQHAQRTREHIAERAPEVEVAIGIGRPSAGLAGLRRSFAQAQESLSLVRSLFGGGKVLSFGDLTLYHLLGRLQACDELAEFHEQTLASLEAYDAGHDTQLVDTLDVFFSQHGNVSQTAERLYLHRNSLLYRLERIAEITGLDLDDADARFALQLALKLRPFVLNACPAELASPSE
jgi:purine catabolism regulator